MGRTATALSPRQHVKACAAQGKMSPLPACLPACLLHGPKLYFVLNCSGMEAGARGGVPGCSAVLGQRARLAHDAQHQAHAAVDTLEGLVRAPEAIAIGGGGVGPARWGGWGP